MRQHLNDEKVHYKLYKDGKNWVAASIATGIAIPVALFSAAFLSPVLGVQATSNDPSNSFVQQNNSVINAAIKSGQFYDATEDGSSSIAVRPDQVQSIVDAHMKLTLKGNEWELAPASQSDKVDFETVLREIGFPTAAISAVNGGSTDAGDIQAVLSFVQSHGLETMNGGVTSNTFSGIQNTVLSGSGLDMGSSNKISALTKTIGSTKYSSIVSGPLNKIGDDTGAPAGNTLIADGGTIQGTNVLPNSLDGIFTRFSFTDGSFAQAMVSLRDAVEKINSYLGTVATDIPAQTVDSNGDNQVGLVDFSKAKRDSNGDYVFTLDSDKFTPAGMNTIDFLHKEDYQGGNVILYVTGKSSLDFTGHATTFTTNSSFIQNGHLFVSVPNGNDIVFGDSSSDVNGVNLLAPTSTYISRQASASGLVGVINGDADPSTPIDAGGNGYVNPGDGSDTLTPTDDPGNDPTKPTGTTTTPGDGGDTTTTPTSKTVTRTIYIQDDFGNPLGVGKVTMKGTPSTILPNDVTFTATTQPTFDGYSTHPTFWKGSVQTKVDPFTATHGPATNEVYTVKYAKNPVAFTVSRTVTAKFGDGVEGDTTKLPKPKTDTKILYVDENGKISAKPNGDAIALGDPFGELTSANAPAIDSYTDPDGTTFTYTGTYDNEGLDNQTITDGIKKAAAKAGTEYDYNVSFVYYPSSTSKHKTVSFENEVFFDYADDDYDSDPDQLPEQFTRTAVVSYLETTDSQGHSSYSDWKIEEGLPALTDANVPAMAGYQANVENDISDDAILGMLKAMGPITGGSVTAETQITYQQLGQVGTNVEGTVGDPDHVYEKDQTPAAVQDDDYQVGTNVEGTIGDPDHVYEEDQTPAAVQDDDYQVGTNVEGTVGDPDHVYEKDQTPAAVQDDDYQVGTNVEGTIGDPDHVYEKDQTPAAVQDDDYQVGTNVEGTVGDPDHVYEKDQTPAAVQDEDYQVGTNVEGTVGDPDHVYEKDQTPAAVQDDDYQVGTNVEGDSDHVYEKDQTPDAVQDDDYQVGTNVEGTVGDPDHVYEKDQTPAAVQDDDYQVGTNVEGTVGDPDHVYEKDQTPAAVQDDDYQVGTNVEGTVGDPDHVYEKNQTPAAVQDDDYQVGINVEGTVGDPDHVYEKDQTPAAVQDDDYQVGTNVEGTVGDPDHVYEKDQTPDAVQDDDYQVGTNVEGTVGDPDHVYEKDQTPDAVQDDDYQVGTNVEGTVGDPDHVYEKDQTPAAVQDDDYQVGTNVEGTVGDPDHVYEKDQTPAAVQDDDYQVGINVEGTVGDPDHVYEKDQTPDAVQDYSQTTTTTPSGDNGQTATTTTPIGDDGQTTTTTTPSGNDGQTTTTTTPSGDDGQTTTTTPGGNDGQTTTTTTPGGNDGQTTTTTTPSGNDGQTTTTTTPSGDDGQTTTTTPGGDDGQTTTPTTPSGDGQTTTTTPSGDDGQTTTPTTPSGDDGQTTTTTPSGNDGQTTTTTTPSGNDDQTTTPTTPSGDNDQTPKTTVTTPATGNNGGLTTITNTTNTATPIQTTTPNTTTGATQLRTGNGLTGQTPATSTTTVNPDGTTSRTLTYVDATQAPVATPAQASQTQTPAAKANTNTQTVDANKAGIPDQTATIADQTNTPATDSPAEPVTTVANVIDDNAELTHGNIFIAGGAPGMADYTFFSQPVMDSSTNSVDHYELLLRVWDSKQGGWHLPASFSIPASMEAHLMARAVAQLDVKDISINLTDAQFEDPDTQKAITDLAQSDAVDSLTVELATIPDSEELATNAKVFQAAGVKVTLDNLGSHTDGTQLANAADHVDTLKVSLRGMRRDGNNLTQMTNQLAAWQKAAAAHNDSLEVEGLETPEDLAMTNDLGITAVQGYYFSRPAMPGTRADLM